MLLLTNDFITVYFSYKNYIFSNKVLKVMVSVFKLYFICQNKLPLQMFSLKLNDLFCKLVLILITYL